MTYQMQEGAASAAEGDKVAGNIPEGIWVLDQQASRKLMPTSHTLWIIKDDGRYLQWVSIETTQDGTQVTSYANHYDADAAPVTGGPFVASITSPQAGTLVTTGTIEGLGTFREVAQLSADRLQLIADGEVKTQDGSLSWHEVFDYAGTGPHLPLAE